MSEYTSFDNETDILLHAANEHVLTYAEFEERKQQAALRAQHEAQHGSQSAPETAPTTPVAIIGQVGHNVYAMRHNKLAETITDDEDDPRNFALAA